MRSHGDTLVHPRLRASLMERLGAPLSPMPRGAEAPERPVGGVDIQAFASALGQEIAVLLNSRLPRGGGDLYGARGEELPWLYGMPELGPGGVSQSDSDAICRALLRALHRFEPRLGELRVQSLGMGEEGRLQIQISGTLRVGRRGIPIAFDTELHPLTHCFELEALR